MIGLATNFEGVDVQTVEMDRSPFSSLMTQVLTLLASDRLNQESIIKMVHRCNYSLFSLADTAV